MLGTAAGQSGRILARLALIALVVGVCALAGTTSLSFIVQRLGAPYPVRISWKAEVAYIGIDRFGRIAVSITPALAHATGGDMLAFLYLHEVGHARAGHLRPRDPGQTRYFMAWEFRNRMWRMEDEADEWAARRSVAAGYDPVRGIAQLFREFGDGGGLTHPPDGARIERVRRIAGAARR